MAGSDASGYSAMYAQQATQFLQYGAVYYPSLVPAGEPRSLFITGFPLNIRDRELNNLLRFIPGYEVYDYIIFASYQRTLSLALPIWAPS
jgi:hypothetical protein